jgi:hypothetical protein
VVAYSGSERSWWRPRIAPWLPRLKEIIPSYGSLIGEAGFTRRIRVATAAVLNIEQV